MDCLGAIKIKDGLFIGDANASQDLEFIISNKVSHIVNTCSSTVPNSWESIGVKYLNFSWEENTDFIDLSAIDLTRLFVEEALALGGSVLVHSFLGKNRSVVLVCAYLMVFYRWSLDKAIDFLKYRRPDLVFESINMQQLAFLDSSEFTKRWTDLTGELHIDSEELMIRNTFINSKSAPSTSIAKNTGKRKRILKWNEQKDKNKAMNKIENGFIVLKSCLKGSSKDEALVPLQCLYAKRNKTEKKKRSAEGTKRTKASKKDDKVTRKEDLCLKEEDSSGILEKAPRKEGKKERENTKTLHSEGKTETRTKKKVHNRPPSPMIKSNKNLQNIRKPMWK